MINLKKNTHNNTIVIKMTIQNSNLKKRIILPPFVKQIKFKERSRNCTLIHTIWKVSGNLEKQKGISPEFNSIDDLMSYLTRHHPNIKFIVCPYSLKKGFETLVPTLPATMFNHLKEHHVNVLKKLRINPKKYSPIVWSYKKGDYSRPFLEKSFREKKNYLKVKNPSVENYMTLPKFGPSYKRKKILDL